MFFPLGVSSEARPAVPFVAHWLVNVQIRSLLVAADKSRLRIASVLSLVCMRRPVVFNISNAQSFKGAFTLKRLFHQTIAAVNRSLPAATEAAPAAVQAGLVAFMIGCVSAGKEIRNGSLFQTLQGPDWRLVNPASAQHGSRRGQNRRLAGRGNGEEGGRFKACCWRLM